MSPDQIARGIVVKYFSGGDEDGEELIVKIAAALREQFDKGFKNGFDECNLSIPGIEKEADAKGYRRGVEESAKEAADEERMHHKYVVSYEQGQRDEADIIEQRILALLQRGQGGGGK